jgi:hypothetical protein
VPWDHRRGRRGHEVEQARDRAGPLQRVGVAILWRAALLDQVAGKEHGRVGDDHDDVVVGVAAAKVAQLDRTAA